MEASRMMGKARLTLFMRVSDKVSLSHETNAFCACFPLFRDACAAWQGVWHYSSRDRSAAGALQIH